MHDEIIAWRRDLHANPELGYELPRTASFVADKLRAFGCDQISEGVGRSAHAASPQAGVDALLPAANILIALQTVIARNVHPLKSGVISFGSFQGGKPGGTFVGTSELRGLARWFEPEVRDTMHRRIIDISEGIAASYGATATVTFRSLYPAVVNHSAETALAVKVACSVMGEDSVDPDHSQLMGSEDFAFMLEQRPGNIALLGNGSTAGLHDSAYDFNDAAIPYGIAYWTRLIEISLPLQNS